MASSAEAEALTERHRAAQVANAAAVAYLVTRAWSAVRVDALDRTARIWLAAIIPFIVAARRRSAALAAAYANSYRRLELGGVDAPRLYQPVNDVNLDQIRTSLMVTGPVAVHRQLDRLVAPTSAEVAELLERRGQAAGAAALRHVQNGGRDTVAAGVDRDRRALGHVRVTRGNCCYFCAMLASRGPKYKDDSFEASDARFTGPGEHKVHDKCFCSLEPVYHRSTSWPGRAREFEDLWMRVKKDNAGSEVDMLLAFRRAYEGRS